MIDLINYRDLFHPNSVVNIGSGQSYTLQNMALAILREHQKIFKSKLDLLQSQDSKGRELEKLCYQSSLYDFFQIETNNSTIAKDSKFIAFLQTRIDKMTATSSVNDSQLISIVMPKTKYVCK